MTRPPWAGSAEVRPVQLTIEGLRSFRRAETIDFTGRSHIAMIGDTGAGKSSILEAITFALYGHTTWAKQANQFLVCDTAQRLRVELVFSVRGETWRVQRAIRLDGKRAPRPADAKLELLDEHGEPTERVDNVTAVNRRVQELLGLDWEAFIRTVVLPQGQFAQLLVADRPTRRAEILQQVWRTDELVAAGRAVDAALAALSEPAGRLAQARSGYPDDPAAELTRLTREAVDATTSCETAQRRLDDARGAVETLSQAQEALAQLAQARSVLSAIDLSGIEERARALADLDEALRGEREGLDRAAAETRARRDAIPGEEDDGPGAAATGAAKSVVQELPRDLDALLRGGAQAAARRSAIEGAQADAERLRWAAAEAHGCVEERTSARMPLHVMHAEAADAQRKATGLVADARAVARRAEQERRASEAARRAAGTASAGAERARAAADQASAASAMAEAALRLAQRADAAATAAHGLHPGDDCPVCRRGLDDGWAPPDAEDLDDAVRAFAEAKARAARLQRAEATAAATAVAKLASARDAERRAVEAGELSAGLRGEAAAALDIPPGAFDLDADDAELLVAVDRAVHERAGVLAAFDSRTEELRTMAQHAGQAAAAAEERARGLVEAAATATRNVQAALDGIRYSIALLPAVFRPELALPADAAAFPWVLDLAPVHRVAGAIAAREALLQERTRQRAELARRLDAVLSQSRELNTRCQREVTDPLHRLRRTLDSHRERIDRLELPVVLPSYAADARPEALAGVAVGLADAHAHALATVHDRTTAQRDREGQARDRLAGLGAGPEDPTGRRLLDRFEQERDDAAYRARRAHEQAAGLTEALPRIARLDELADRLAERRAVLTDLSGRAQTRGVPEVADPVAVQGAAGCRVEAAHRDQPGPVRVRRHRRGGRRVADLRPRQRPSAFPVDVVRRGEVRRVARAGAWDGGADGALGRPARVIVPRRGLRGSRPRQPGPSRRGARRRRVPGPDGRRHLTHPGRRRADRPRARGDPASDRQPDGLAHPQPTPRRRHRRPARRRQLGLGRAPGLDSQPYVR